MSPNALSPNGKIDSEQNPFESEFVDDRDGEDIEDEGLIDFTPPGGYGVNNFAVLNSSLPGEIGPQQHHLTSFASARRSGTSSKEKKQHRTRWHFGIRSRSPPMEVVSAIYASLRSLGMEWKEKRDLGGLCAFHPKSKDRAKIERRRQWDSPADHRVDLRAAAQVYLVETRSREGDVVVRHAMFYLVPNVFLFEYSGRHEYPTLLR